MRTDETPQGIELNGVEFFNVRQIFTCGQCFRFHQLAENTFEGIAGGKALKISQNDKKVVLYHVTKREFDAFWKSYFCFDENYAEIRSALAGDPVLRAALEFSCGIRILRQDLWEIIVSFIISQNNNIPRITKCIEAVCAKYGQELLPGKYSFPAPPELSAASASDLRALGLGYRDAYVADAVRKVLDDKISLPELIGMDTPLAREKLSEIKGVGGKVSDCILLFGLHRYEVFPHDVWIKRVLSEQYRLEKVTQKEGYRFARSNWGRYAGLAQQYLFYAARENRQSEERA